MALKCETCGADSPATNCYCGQCGARLERFAADTPENSVRAIIDRPPIQPLEASADLPPEVIDFDNQIPLIANNGDDRRLHLSPELAEQVHDHLEREAQLHDQLRHGSESHFETRAQPEAGGEPLRQSRSDYLRWDDASHDAGATGSNAGFDVGGNPRFKATPVAASKPTPVRPLAQRNFLPEGQRTTRTGVSGPSFLGLTDDRPPGHDDEDRKPDSHLWRNVALAVLGVASFLTAMQWPSIREYALPYVQAASTQLWKGTPANPAAAAADRNPATDQTGTTQAAGSSRTVSGPLPVNAANSPPPAQDVPASPAAASAPQLPKMDAPVAEVTMDVPEKEPPIAASHSTAKLRPAPSAGSVSRDTIPGVDEMNRAARSSDAEARAAWLWKAIAKGNPQAPVELAKMYEEGNGVVRSCDQAQVLLRAAAAKGSEQARLSLRQLRIRGCSTQ